VGELQADLDTLAGAVDALEEGVEVAALDDAVTGGGSSADSVAGPLPPYPSSGADPAVQSGLRLPALTGDEYYSGERMTFAPDGENATVWVVWAHWCPHCQADLPALATFLTEAAEDYPHVQVVTISTSIDDSRGNPLVPYLDASQFGFPVLVDPDGSLATSLGTPAFPFWVVTAPDGQVLLRRPGEFGRDQLASLFGSIEEFVAG
jgi:thiol-disulfide isomerase/thioredoxin